MQSLPYTIFAGLAVITIGLAVILGGEMWLVPAIVLPVTLAYVLYDRRAARNETKDERLGATRGGR